MQAVRHGEGEGEIRGPGSSAHTEAQALQTSLREIMSSPEQDTRQIDNPSPSTVVSGPVSVVEELAELAFRLVEALESGGETLELEPLREGLRSLKLLPSISEEESTLNHPDDTRRRPFTEVESVRWTWPILSAIVTTWISKQVDNGTTTYSQISNAVESQCHSFLVSKLNLENVTTNFVSSLRQARKLALQSALHHRYPLLATEGCSSMSRPPVLYVCETAGPLLESLERVWWELLLSPSCVQTVPAVEQHNQHGFFSYTHMDLDALQRKIDQDKGRGHLPWVVIANLHVDQSDQVQYHLDKLEALRRICDEQGMWLHVEGNAVDLYLSAATQRPKGISMTLECADSISCQPLEWFGVSSDLACSLLTNAPASTSNVLPPSQPCDLYSVLPLWMILITLGRDHQNKLRTSVDHLLDVATALVLNSEHNEFSLRLGPMAREMPHRVLIQVEPKLDLSELHLDLSTFNVVLANRLQEFTHLLGIRPVDHHGHPCMILAPDGLDRASRMSIEDVQDFLSAIGKEVRDLHMALEARSLLEDAIIKQDELVWIPPSQFAEYVGIGAFRLMPVFLESKRAEDRHNALNLLNQSFAETLNSMDNVFQAVGTVDDQVCVSLLALPRVGPNSHNPTEAVKSAVDLIEHAAGRQEMPSEVLELLAESLQHGISQAEMKVRSHIDNQYTPDQLIRAIPVVGTMFSWVLPGNEEDGDSGQAFDINSNHLRSSSSIKLDHKAREGVEWETEQID